jgi:hypothetical protein
VTCPSLGLPQAVKYTPAQSRKLCEVAGHIGYCLEPDARLTGKGYAAEDRVAVFLRMTDGQPEPHSSAVPATGSESWVIPQLA